MKTVRPALWLFLFGLTLLAAACAKDRTGPMIALYEGESVRQIPARCFDEDAYLRRGYLKNTDARGHTIYTYLPETDRPYEPSMGGNTGQGVLWYGDRGGGQGRGGMGAVGISGGGNYN